VERYKKSYNPLEIGHMPRLMLRVVYKPGENFFIGDLQNRISLNFDVEEEKIRSIKDFSIKLDFTNASSSK